MNISSGSVAKVLLLNKHNEALLLTVGEYKLRPDKAFKPDLPGGMVDAGEPELSAVRRELEEETGILLEVNDFTLAYEKIEHLGDEGGQVHKFIYVARIKSVPEVRLSPEHISYEWVNLNDLRSTIELRPFYKEAIEYCFMSGLLK